MGARDFAILMLLARLGPRAVEVARLELDDLHWRAGEIEIDGKGHEHGRLPLPSDVGEALVAYLTLRGRREGRRVFLTVHPRRDQSSQLLCFAQDSTDGHLPPWTGTSSTSR